MKINIETDFDVYFNMLQLQKSCPPFVYLWVVIFWICVNRSFNFTTKSLINEREWMFCFFPPITINIIEIWLIMHSMFMIKNWSETECEMWSSNPKLCILAKWIFTKRFESNWAANLLSEIMFPLLLLRFHDYKSV